MLLLALLFACNPPDDTDDDGWNLGDTDPALDTDSETDTGIDSDTGVDDTDTATDTDSDETDTDSADTDSGDSGDTGSTGDPPDACGFAGDDGVWLSFKYEGAYTPRSPRWSYSSTPGFGEAQWAPRGESWPEVWDLDNNTEVRDDRIGRVAEIDGRLQLMFGIPSVSSYSKATVCIEGRSVATSSTVRFAITNPANGDCGAEGTMAHDWTVHATGLDLGSSCVIAGGDFQAIRIDPNGGSGTLGLTRFTLTLHDAVY